MLVDIHNLKSKSFDEVKQAIFDLDKIRTDFVLSKNIKSDPLFWSAVASLADFVRFAESGENKESSNRDLNFISLLDVGLVKTLVDDFHQKQIVSENISVDFSDLFLQVSVLSALTAVSFENDLYTPAQWKEMIKNKISTPEIKLHKFFATLQEASKNPDDAADLQVNAIKFLTELQFKVADDLEWKIVVLLTFLLQFLFDRLGKLSESDRKLLFERYFYLSVILGVSVRSDIQKKLREFEWPMPYVNYGYELVTYLDANTEIISEKQTEAIDIYNKLKVSELIDWEKEGGSLLNYENKEDLAKLYAYFGFGEQFVNLVTYFKNEPKIPLKLFLQKFSKVADLSDNETTEKLVHLSEIFHTNNLISNDQELIEFHESDNKFHWAQWITQ